ncbi:diacylglycerol/lipid kinase family protein [Candidatus Weimeria sp. HCP3S3_B5]|uniref:diacylglycerol/lipid kinase family protein n=1 Tax=Candidatus Weimeria sp. HCP3S3_B5 TaxID=3438871 RepID=UPI002A931FB1|nr:YegS/Rv2252/BmrU family lipid kinase [Lachnospiraceae bacterium]MDY6351846.1 YegS/Rv2252/BmrU family lipid kinase [Lachnospiraceae bacterium]
MGKKLLFIYNPHSGRGMIRMSLSDIIEIMVRAGYEVSVYPTQKPKDAMEQTLSHGGEYDRIVVSGGDGTLDEVVTGVMKSGLDVPVGYIPAGSTNDFGASLGIPKDMTQAANIASWGIPRAFDVGRFGDDYFVYVAAFGIFTQTAYSTSQQLKNVLGHSAYILSAFKQLRDIPSYRMQVEYDGNVLYDEFIFGMVTNTLSVGGIKGIIPGDKKLDDGLFEVTLVKTPKNPMELNEIVGGLTGVLKDADTDMVSSFQTRSIVFTTAEEIPWTLDGEYGGSVSKVQIENLHRKMNIVVESDQKKAYNVSDE